MRAHDPAETVAPIINPNFVTATLGASLENVVTAFERSKVVIVVDGDRPVGILTKIDLIDFVSGQIR